MRAPLLLPVLAGLSACGGGPTPAPLRGAVLMTVDSLRRDHVSAYGHRSPFGRQEPTTPAFDALAEEGVLFEEASSTTSWTLPSHAALFTGLPDPLHGVVDNGARIAPELRTLAELFADDGYRTAGSFAGPNLHPAFGFDQGFESWIDCSGVELDGELFENAGSAAPGSFLETHRASHRSVTSPATLRVATEFLRQRADDGSPFFLFVHWWDAHYDYSPPAAYLERFADPSYRGRFRGEHGTEKTWPAGPADVTYLKSLYDAEIRYTDDHVAELLAELEALDLAERSAVCLTSDHGEEFYEHGRWGHQRTLYEEVLQIPLALRAPGHAPAGLRVRGRVSLQDVYATFAGLFDLDAPGYIDSRDLAERWRAPRGPGEPAYAHLDVPLREVRLSTWNTGRFKAQLDHTSGVGTVFDLERDPRERSPRKGAELGEGGARALEGLLQELARFEAVRPHVPGDGSSRSDLSEELLLKLEAAGYVVR